MFNNKIRFLNNSTHQGDTQLPLMNKRKGNDKKHEDLENFQVITKSYVSYCANKRG